ncbi:hypothetical protein VCHA53O466_140057 [Vibrio chagasii]|nr:hypothetical protein VCHA53O466_140057 [Vibrio chagasii]
MKDLAEFNEQELELINKHCECPFGELPHKAVQNQLIQLFNRTSPTTCNRYRDAVRDNITSTAKKMNILGLFVGMLSVCICGLNWIGGSTSEPTFHFIIMSILLAVEVGVIAVIINTSIKGKKRTRYLNAQWTAHNRLQGFPRLKEIIKHEKPQTIS